MQWNSPCVMICGMRVNYEEITNDMPCTTSLVTFGEAIQQLWYVSIALLYVRIVLLLYVCEMDNSLGE